MALRTIVLRQSRGCFDKREQNRPAPEQTNRAGAEQTQKGMPGPAVRAALDGHLSHHFNGPRHIWRRRVLQGQKINVLPFREREICGGPLAKGVMLKLDAVDSQLSEGLALNQSMDDSLMIPFNELKMMVMADGDTKTSAHHLSDLAFHSYHRPVIHLTATDDGKEHSQKHHFVRHYRVRPHTNYVGVTSFHAVPDR